MVNNMHKLIHKAIADGDWTLINDTVTRKQLIDYLIVESKTDDKIQCPICMKHIKPNKVTFTHRSAKYLLSAIFLSDRNIREGGDGYIHHDEIRKHAMGNWLYERGKKVGYGINYTSYSNLTRFPYDFLEPMVKTEDKKQRSGEFKPTERCRQFLRGELDIPESITILNREVIRYSSTKVNILKLKDVNFHQCVELFKSFS